MVAESIVSLLINKLSDYSDYSDSRPIKYFLSDLMWWLSFCYRSYFGSYFEMILESGASQFTLCQQLEKLKQKKWSD